MKKTTTSENKEETGLQKYERVRELGRGSAGSVTQIRYKYDGQFYALKTINLEFLNDEKEKKNAENEVQFLRVLKGPTLIRFIEAFVQNRNIYIIMEFAEGGNLA